MEQLLKDGKVHRGQLGVVIQNITEDMAKTLELKDSSGVIVSEVKKDGAAEKAGIKRGDVIIAINGEKIEDSNTLRNKVAGTAPGSDIKLTVLRDRKEQEFSAKLDEFAINNAKTELPKENDKEGKSNQSGKLGVDLQPVTPEIAKQLGMAADTKGMVVTDVDPTGPAAEEGIDRGDVLMEINRQPVSTFEDVQSALTKAGDKPSLLLISRKGQTSYLTIEPKK